MSASVAARDLRGVEGFDETTVAVIIWLTLIRQTKAADKLLTTKKESRAAGVPSAMKTQRYRGEKSSQNNFRQQINRIRHPDKRRSSCDQ